MISFPFTANPILNTSGVIIGYDRSTNSQDNRRLNHLLYTDGVNYSFENCFRVVADTGMTIKVLCTESNDKIAWAKIGDAFAYEYSDFKTFELADSDTSFPRIDRIVLRKDDNTEVRNVSIVVLTGVPSVNPTPQNITRTETIYDIVLSDIYVGANVISIFDTNITDQRLNDDLCGKFKSKIIPETIIPENILEKTTAPITYYVATTGSNTNNGLTVETPFATIQHAIDKLPKYLMHRVEIKIADGTYSEDVIIENFFGGYLKISRNEFEGTLPSPVKISSIKIQGNSCTTEIEEIDFTTNIKNAVVIINNPGYVFLDYISATSETSEYDGVSVDESSQCSCWRFIISNKNNAFRVENTVLDVAEGSGANNIVGYYLAKVSEFRLVGGVTLSASTLYIQTASCTKYSPEGNIF